MAKQGVNLTADEARFASKTAREAQALLHLDGELLEDGAAKAERCAMLLKNVMRDLPPTDIRANAIEAADEVLAWVKQVRG